MIALLLAVALGIPQGQPLSGPALDQKTQEVASLLRCPVCQGMSVADSPSTVAQDMKHQVREMLSKGYTQEQILAYFEQSYGQFVLEKPKNPLVWILPIAILLIGAVVVVTTAKRLSSEGPATGNQEPATDPYIEQVRKLVNHD
ncbi:MAG TPA: cytochrome c-type biogenesis protein [Thermoanaerobaculia bacterium]|nr:cytochrome c-type biogenesis protein [Thermoanaerobaculia bacterium]